MAKDPICGMTVDEASALHAERDGQTFYFCSDHCRQKFLLTPAARQKHEKRSRRVKPSTPARCIRKSSRIIPAIAPSAAWRWNQRR